MIVTCKKEVPTRWIIFAILPWASFTFNGGVVGVAFLFSLKKFIENPAGLTFVLSLPNVLSIIVGPATSFLSDRVWTRVGRRKPFVVAAWTGMAVSMALMPLMPNVWLLVAAFIVYQVASALNAPMEPLKQEIIPPQERGFATGAMTWCSNLATVTFYYIMLGRFDDVTYLAGLPISGEAVIYWSAALLLSVMLIIIVLGIRETDPKSTLRGQRLSWRNILGGVADQELWPVYLLVFGSAFLNFYAGLGPLSNLLYTDQWGYTKQEMGVNVAVGGVVNIFVIGLLTAFADRLNRMRAYQTTICLLLAGNAAYYCYVTFVLPDQHPTLIEIILFGETISMLSILTGLLYIPLVYDYVRRNKMGTYGAGAGLISRVATIITLNGVGLFVWVYAVLFQPPAGEMTRVVLKREAGQPQVLAALTGATGLAEQPVQPKFSARDLSARVWQANGITAKEGQTWEVRLRDKESENLAAEKTRLEAGTSSLTSEETGLRNKAAAFRRRGQTTLAGQAEQAANTTKIGLDQLSKKAAAIESELARKAGAFRDRVQAALGDWMIADGDQLLAARTRPAVLVTLATTRLLDDPAAQKMLEDLGREYPAAIDLHAVVQTGRFGLSASAFADPGANEDATAEALRAAMTHVAQKRAPGLLAPGGPLLERRTGSALTLDLGTVEEPVEGYVSPVTRVVNSILAWFDHAVSPTRRLTAIGRNLRSPGETDQVRVQKGPTARSLSVTAILQDTAVGAAPLDDPVGRRLAGLLGSGTSDDAVRQARAFYDRIDKAAAAQRITIARPLITAAYAPMQYDYMSGYLWMFVMAAIGIGLTVWFGRLEANGVVRKYGVEEAAST